MKNLIKYLLLKPLLRGLVAIIPVVKLDIERLLKYGTGRVKADWLVQHSLQHIPMIYYKTTLYKLSFVFHF